MMTHEERLEIEKLLNAYPTGRAAALEAIKIVQERKKWVSDEDILELSKLLKMTADELDEITTFYSQIFRKPVGEHVIRICDSVSCWMNGSENLEERLIRLLGSNPGETTSDGRFTLLPVSCLGVCEKSPVMMVDDDLYTDLKAEDLEKIIRHYAEGGLKDE